MGTYNGVGDEDVEEAVAVEVELEQGRYGVIGGEDKLGVPVRAGNRDAVSQQVQRMHHNILRVSRETQIKIPREDLLLHVEEIFHQLGQQNPL